MKRLKFKIPYLFSVLLFITCTNNNIDNSNNPPNLSSLPITVDVNTKIGYNIHPLTRDTIEPLLNSTGDTIITGVSISIKGTLVKRLPDGSEVYMGIKKKVGKPKIRPNQLNVHKVPENLSITEVNKALQKRKYLSESHSDFTLLNSIGDTIHTGISFPISGKIIHSNLPQSINALVPDYNFNTINNMKSLDVGHGLAGAYITSILEDKNSNIWFATLGGGVSKYDGYSFTNYTETHGLSNNNVRAMIEDQNGNLWFGTEGGGVSMYNGRFFTHYSENQGLSSNYVRMLTQDRSGNIWIGTSGGGVSKLSLGNEIEGESIIHYTIKEGLAHNSVRGITEDVQGNIWISNWDNKVGISKLVQNNLEDKGAYFEYYSKEQGLCGNSINFILEDDEDNLWIVGGRGANKLEYIIKSGKTIESITSYTTKEGLCGNTVYSAAIGKKGSLWFGTYGGGVSNLIKNAKGEHFFVNYTENDGLNTNEVYFIMVDKSGNSWFGNWGGGLSIYKKESFSHYTIKEGLCYNRVYSILEDDHNNYWTSCDGGGPTALNLDNSNQVFVNSISNYFKEEGIKYGSIYSMIQDKNGDLWLGTTNAGLYHLTMNEGIVDSFVLYSTWEGLSNNRVTTLLEDKLGNIWVGTYNGLNKITKRKIHGKEEIEIINYNEDTGLSSEVINSIEEDNTNNIWIGTYKGGVSKLEINMNNGLETITHYSTKEGLSNNTVQSILNDQNGNLWFGTEGGGVTMFDGEKFTYYTVNEGLTSNFIKSLIEDNNGNIWVATVSGLNQFVPIDGDTTKVNNHYKIIKYDTKDGLKSIDFLPNSVHVDSKNRIWWGSSKSLCMLDINSFNIYIKPPVVQLNAIDINEKFIDFHSLKSDNKSGISFDKGVPFYNYPQNLVLEYDNNYLTFHFSAIDWHAPHKIKYSYIIDELDLNWSKPSEESRADYRNIPTGKHLFKVRAIGESGEWGKIFEYQFTVCPPWWYSWWAYLLYFIFAILVLHYIYHFLLSRKLALSESHRLKEINQLKSSLYTNITHEFRTPLTVIQGMSETLQMNVENKQFEETEISIEMIQRNCNRLLHLVNEMLDLAKIENGNMDLSMTQSDIIPFVKYLGESFHSMAAKKKINLTVYSEIEELMMDFDANKMASIVTNLLSNAIKFTSENGKIIIHLNKIVEKGNHFFTIKIKDNGRGISPQDIGSIFNRFYQVDSSISREQEGTGIGLTLTKEFVELMDGTISVTSVLNEGTIFNIQLPVNCTTSYKQNINTEENTLLTEKFPLTLDSILIKEDKSNKKPLILIIEDNQDVAFYLESCLKEKYNTLWANNGLIGIDMAMNDVPDIIICDVMMPGKNGFEVCAILKSNEITDHIPIIMLTAKATIQDRLIGLSHGADAYLSKPFLKAELFTRLDQLIFQRQKMVKKFERSDLGNLVYSRRENPEIKFIQKTIKIIQNNIGNVVFTSAQLSQKLQLSESQVYRKIKAITDKSTGIFIRSIRLHKGKELIQLTDKTIAEIAYEVGFNDPAYFSRVFKEEFGYPPSDLN